MHKFAPRIAQLARRAALASVLAAGIGAATSSVALAETLTVTRTDDPSPSNCEPGNCSLREAINAANNDGGATIELQGGQTYTLQQPAGIGPLPVGGALLNLHNTTIKATGTGNASINANGNTIHDRAFDVLGGTLELHHVDVTGGVNNGRLRPGGGGVLVDGGSFYMYDGNLGGNTSNKFGWVGGGGVYNYNGHVVLVRDYIAGNDAENEAGGAVYTGRIGQTEIYDAKLFDNRASLGGALASDERGAGGNVSVTRAQISFNRGDTAGGAVFDRGDLQNGGVAYRLANVTINNNAANDGGALSVWNAHVTLNNDTISKNAAQMGGGISAHGDRYESAGNTAVRLSNTILAQNTSYAGHSPDCLEARGGEFYSGGFNLVGDDTGCQTGLLVLHRGADDQLGNSASPIDPKLDTTAFNGGAISLLLTMKLQPGSPAIDAGDPTPGSCEPTDARGVYRSAGGRCDIGAYEVAPPPVKIKPLTKPKITVQLSPSQVRAGRRVLLTATLSSTDAHCIANATVHIGAHRTVHSDAHGHVAVPVRFHRAGAQTVSASKPGCVTGSTSLTVAPAG